MYERVLWTYNSPNFINVDIFCFNKNNTIHADATSLPHDYAVM